MNNLSGGNNGLHWEICLIHILYDALGDRHRGTFPGLNGCNRTVLIISHIIKRRNVDTLDFSGGTGKSGEVEYTVNQLGADRVVFGTDLSEVSFAVPYGRLVEAKISDEDKAKILYRNTMKLYYGREV